MAKPTGTATQARESARSSFAVVGGVPAALLQSPQLLRI